jgi:hypothetical protein
MAIAVVQDWPGDGSDRSTTNYDTLTERLRAQGPIDGLLVHTAGFFGGGFRIFEVWESEGHYQAFLRDRFLPLLAESVPAAAAQPETDVYELHAFQIP